MKVTVADPTTVLAGRRARHVGRVAQIITSPLWLAEVVTRYDGGGCWYPARELQPLQNRRSTHEKIP